MADVYKVAVALSMTSNAPAFLSALSSKLLHVHSQVKDLEGGLTRLNRIKLAVGGGLAIAGGSAALAAVGKMVDKGNELIKIQQNMAQAGVKAVEVQEAYAKAWELTGKYTNVGAAEALKVINEARMTFGSQEDATHHSEDFIKMISFLKAFQGGKHGGGAAEFEREAISAMKSGEIAGKITPAEMAEHVKQLTAMRVAYGDQLKISQYLTAQRAGGVALRNTSDTFRYGAFPALVQENGPGAGVMLMTAFNKIVAGTGNKLAAMDAMSKVGILDEKKVAHHPISGKVTKVEAGAILGDKLFAENPLEWTDKVLRPKLDAITKDPIEQAQWISKMFPDRNAAKAITEMLQQYTKLSKDAAMMLQARGSINEGKYLDKSWEGQKQAFHEQWENFVQALGAPMVATATENLKKVNSALSGMAQWAARPEMAATVEAIGKGIAILGAALTAGGATALLAALGPAGWIAVGIVGVTAAFVAFKEPFDNWVKAVTGMGTVLDTLDKKFNDAATAFADFVSKIFNTLTGGLLGNKAIINGGKPTGTLDDAMGLPGIQKQSFQGEGFRSLIQNAAFGGGSGTSSPFAEGVYQGVLRAMQELMGRGGSGGGGGGFQTASFTTGGGANDNFGGASGVGRSLGRGGFGNPSGGAGLVASGGGRTVPRGAFGPGTGAGNSWYEAIMRAEGTAGKDPYNVVLGNGRYGLPSKPLTDMSLAEAYQFGRSVRARHGSSSAIGAFQIVGQTMKNFMGEAGLGWNDKFSPENQRKLAAVIRRHQGFGAWEGFKVHPGELRNAREMNPYGKDPAPTAGPPPKAPANKPIMVDLHMDGKKMGRAIAMHQADDHLFPKKAGGMDTHGSFRSPGTPVTDAA